jgi:hypothetical protein
VTRQAAWPCPYHAGEGMMTIFGRPGLDWTVVLRRRPSRLAAAEPEGGYTDMFEIICCDRGDDPDLDYREVSPRNQRIRAPYPVVTGSPPTRSTSSNIPAAARATMAAAGRMGQRSLAGRGRRE